MTDAKPQRVLVHSGFHKTGTSSLQGFLERHSEALSPYFYGFGRFKAPQIDETAKAFAQRRFPWRLLAFRMAVRGYLSGAPKDRNIVMSIEALSGLMPGHRALGGREAGSYVPTAVPMGRVLVDEIKRAFGSDTDVVFLLTTRQKDDWLRSVHGHLLRSIRMTDDLDTFRARFAGLPDLATQADEIASALGGVRVQQAALENYTLARTGPARAVLDLMDVPREVRKSLPPLPRANVGQSVDLRATFLRLNREIGNKAELKARKDGLLHAHAGEIAHVG